MLQLEELATTARRGEHCEGIDVQREAVASRDGGHMNDTATFTISSDEQECCVAALQVFADIMYICSSPKGHKFMEELAEKMQLDVTGELTAEELHACTTALHVFAIFVDRDGNPDRAEKIRDLSSRLDELLYYDPRAFGWPRY
jgi:hypothetical protein